MKEFKDMTETEKKLFLSSDFAERMIRLEQHISTCFHNPVNYDETEYYKCMTERQKEDFERFIKMKKRNKTLLLTLFFSSFIMLFIFNFNITGNIALGNIMAREHSGLFFLALSTILLLIILIILYKFIDYGLRHRKFNNHSKIVLKHLHINHLKK